MKTKRQREREREREREMKVMVAPTNLDLFPKSFRCYWAVCRFVWVRLSLSEIRRGPSQDDYAQEGSARSSEVRRKVICQLEFSIGLMIARRKKK